METPSVPCLLDMDRDGDTDLLLTDTEGRLYGFCQDTFAVVSGFCAPVLPEKMHMSRPYPNPFNSSTMISYSLPATLRVRISIFDCRGRLVTDLMDAF